MAIRYDDARVALKAAAPVRVLVLGLRGVVGVEGGIETHARRLYPLLARMGCEVQVLQRSRYFPRRERPTRWHGVGLKYLWSPARPGLETAVHSLLGVLYAAVARPDILHLHAVGPALLAPLARLLGVRVVFTHHAEDYNREKWGRLARWVLRTGERFGMRFANESIVVSSVIKRRVEKKYRVPANFVPNGAPRAVPAGSTAALERFGLEPGRYVLCVARLDRTKRQLDLIEAFERARLEGWKLALVGALDAQGSYGTAVAKRAAANPAIALTGFQKGKALRELYSHCGAFVLPSALEGHPIALLEALSYGVPVLASAIPENSVLPMPEERFFPVGDAVTLARRLSELAQHGQKPREREELRRLVLERYSWRRAAQQTYDVYDRVLRNE